MFQNDGFFCYDVVISAKLYKLQIYKKKKNQQQQQKKNKKQKKKKKKNEKKKKRNSTFQLPAYRQIPWNSPQNN